MSKGVLRRLGTSQELKSKFGEYFEVAVALKGRSLDAEQYATDVAFVNQVMQELFAEPLKPDGPSSTTSVLMYKVPTAKMNVAETFSILEARLQDHQDYFNECILSYTITQPSLEQVFLAVAQEASPGAEEISENLKTAFDDADVRAAKAAVKTCCRLEKKQHRVVYRVGIVTFVVFFLLVVFFGFDIGQWFGLLFPEVLPKIPRDERHRYVGVCPGDDSFNAENEFTPRQVPVYSGDAPNTTTMNFTVSKVFYFL